MEKVKIGNLTWIDIMDPDKKDLKFLGGNYGFHPVVLKELLSPTLRPKVEHYDGYLFMVLHFPIYYPKEKTTKSMELDFLITNDTLITIRYGKIEPLQSFRKKCRTGEKQLAKDSPATLLNCMIEEINNFSLRQLDHITKKIDGIQKKIFKSRTPKEENEMVEKISLIRMDILNFRRTIKPQGVILRSLKSRGLEFFGKKLEPYFIDIIGDYMRVWDLLENHKDTIESLQGTNDSLLTNKANRVMGVLTMFAVIVFPLTLIAAIFGMNTKILPLVGLPYDFWIIFAIMLTGMIFMLVTFKIKKWL